MPDEDSGELDAVIPVGFSEQVKRRDSEDARPFTLEALKGENVVVRANGFAYRGVLVGADEGELYLKGEMRWVVLPLSTVTDVRLEGRARALGLPEGVAQLAEQAAGTAAGGIDEDAG